MMYVLVALVVGHVVAFRDVEGGLGLGGGVGGCLKIGMKVGHVTQPPLSFMISQLSRG